MMFKGACSPYSAPFIIYAVITVLALIALFFKSTAKTSVSSKIGSVLSAIVWGALIYYLSTNCYYKTAWAALIIPYIFVIIALVFILGLSLWFLSKFPNGKTL